jgi:hypothetical protein
MERFNAFLEGEGISKPDNRLPFTIPVRIKLPTTPLITVRVPDKINFKKEEKTTLAGAADIGLRPGDVVLDRFPCVASKASKGVALSQIQTTRHRAFLLEDLFRSAPVLAPAAPAQWCRHRSVQRQPGAVE